MSPVLIIVTDGTKARFFDVEATENLQGELRLQLVEREPVLNLNHRLLGQDLWSGAESQAGYQGGKGQTHSYDDHRRDHEVEFERRFVQAIASQVLSQHQTEPIQRLLLVAESRVLGLLRDGLIPTLPKTMKVSEVSKNLCQLNLHELRDYLLAKGVLLPAYEGIG